MNVHQVVQQDNLLLDSTIVINQSITCISIWMWIDFYEIVGLFSLKFEVVWYKQLSYSGKTNTVQIGPSRSKKASHFIALAHWEFTKPERRSNPPMQTLRQAQCVWTNGEINKCQNQFTNCRQTETAE